MKQFIKTIFRITPFQAVIIILFSSLKYAINRYNLADDLQAPLIWILLGFGLIFLCSVGLNGIIENKQDVSEPEQTRQKFSRIEKRFCGIINLGIGIPAVIATVLFIYMIVPTTLHMLIALLAGIILRNIFEYFKSRSASVTGEAD